MRSSFSKRFQIWLPWPISLCRLCGRDRRGCFTSWSDFFSCLFCLVSPCCLYSAGWLRYPNGQTFWVLPQPGFWPGNVSQSHFTDLSLLEATFAKLRRKDTLVERTNNPCVLLLLVAGNWHSLISFLLHFRWSQPIQGP